MNLLLECGCLSWLGEVYRMHHEVEVDDTMNQDGEDDTQRVDDKNGGSCSHPASLVVPSMKRSFKKNDFTSSSSSGHENSLKTASDENASSVLSTSLYGEDFKENHFSDYPSRPHEKSLENANKSVEECKQLRKRCGSLDGDLSQFNYSSSTKYSKIEWKNSTIEYAEDADWEII